MTSVIETVSKWVKATDDVQAITHDIQVENGFWDVRNAIMEIVPDSEPTVVIACLGLICSEAVEAMEAARKHDQSTWADWKQKDTLVRELAGTVVRCMDLAGRLNLPLGKAVEAELEACRIRGKMHGGKKA